MANAVNEFHEQPVQLVVNSYHNDIHEDQSRARQRLRAEPDEIKFLPLIHNHVYINQTY